jgi:single-strand DNA-binding protein
MNIVIEQGRPVRDPEIIKSERTGKVFCKFSLAVDRPYRGKDTPQDTDYFEIVIFGKLAQFVYNNLAKGALCTVLGRLTQERYIDKYGDKREKVNIIAQRLTIHEWLRKNRPLAGLESIDPEIVPREITKSLFKQIDVSNDEDIPTELLGRSIDDLV